MGYRTKYPIVLISDLRRALIGGFGALGPGFTFVTVVADYDLADGIDPVGSVTFTLSEPMINDETIVAAPVSRALNIDGVLLIDLAANTDPGTLTPSGEPAYYTVTESMNGAGRSYPVTIPHDAGSTVYLADLRP